MKPLASPTSGSPIGLSQAEVMNATSMNGRSLIVRVDGVEFTDGKATPDDVAGSIRDPARSQPPFN
jgi:hypothetical protein